VALFADGGLEYRLKQEATMRTAPPDTGYKTPYLENVAWLDKSLPVQRHDQGSLCVALADGSGFFAQALGWFLDPGVGIVNPFAASGTYIRLNYVKKYTKRIRVSPYQVGQTFGQIP